MSDIDFKGNTVLVTGGAGFIGSNLVEALLNKNNKVVCLDNFATGKRENLLPFASNPDFLLLEGDIRNLEDCQNAVKGVDFSVDVQIPHPPGDQLVVLPAKVQNKNLFQGRSHSFPED